MSTKLLFFTIITMIIGMTTSWAQSDDFDIFKTITDISFAFYTNEELNYSSNQLDEMLKRLSVKFKNTNSEKEKIGILNTFLFNEMHFQYEKSLDNIKFALLPSVVKERKGNCIGLSTLYLYLGQKLNLPVWGVAAPNHIFVRLKEDKGSVNIELADFGNSHSNQEYAEQFGISKEMETAIYMKDLSNQEVAGVAYLSSGRIDDAIIQLNKALKYNPVNARTYSNLGSAYDDKGEYDLAIISYKKALQIEPDSNAIKNNLSIAEKHRQRLNWSGGRVWTL